MARVNIFFPFCSHLNSRVLNSFQHSYFCAFLLFTYTHKYTHTHTHPQTNKTLLCRPTIAMHQQKVHVFRCIHASLEEEMSVCLPIKHFPKRRKCLGSTANHSRMNGGISPNPFQTNIHTHAHTHTHSFFKDLSRRCKNQVFTDISS